jgi:hypothetical protein
MSAFNLIDMAKVPVPDVIERPDFETKYLKGASNNSIMKLHFQEISFHRTLYCK